MPVEMPPTLTQQLLTPLRDSIIDKPPYTSGTLPLPNSSFSLFYKTTKDGNDARFEDIMACSGGPQGTFG
jgi:hypothetical protein